MNARPWILLVILGAVIGGVAVGGAVWMVRGKENLDLRQRVERVSYDLDQSILSESNARCRSIELERQLRVTVKSLEDFRQRSIELGDRVDELEGQIRGSIFAIDALGGAISRTEGISADSRFQLERLARVIRDIYQRSLSTNQ